MNGGIAYELNQGRECGPCFHSRHELRFEQQEGTDLETQKRAIYEDLRDFRSFNGKMNQVAKVRTEVVDGVRYAFFYTFGIFGWASGVINDEWVAVRIWSDRHNARVHGDTVNLHMLVGQRRWQVSAPSGKPVSVLTEAYEFARGALNRLGRWMFKWRFFQWRLFASDPQMEVWSAYLENINTNHNLLGNSVNPIMEIHPGPNPWQAAQPYPGIEI